MMDQKELLDEAKEYGVGIATAINEGNVRDHLENLQIGWNKFVHSHEPRVQILLREQFYDGYYATRNYTKENG